MAFVAAIKPLLPLKSVFNCQLEDIDGVLLVVAISLLSLGLIMVASSSISVADRNFGNPF